MSLYEKILDIEEESAIETLTTFGFDESKRALKNLTRIAASPLRDGVPLLLELASHAPSPDDALNNLERIAPLLSPESASSLLRDREKIRMLITVCGSSEMLTHTIVKEPTLLDRLLLGNQIKEKKEFDLFKEEIEQCMGENTESDEAARLLRLYRQREYLRIGARDLLTLSPLRETTAELSALADALLKVATDFCLKKLKEKYGTPLYRDGNGGTCEAEFVVIGMGKLGGMELNFSSDIDIIYLYSYDKGETSGTDDQGNNSIALHTFFVRLSEMVTKMIGAVTEDGYVFRVDLDLRPEGTRGAIANSLRGAEIYYESWGQSWERAAMIKARPVAGSLALGEEFLKVIEPFVYRRYLDFTALDEIRAMKEKIDLNHLRRKRERTDVKLGVGGIREIEFFIQALQLIHGGRDSGIRLRNSLDTLATLAERSYIRGEDAALLTEAYTFLRNLEHKIQIVEGRQTHLLPTEERGLQRVSRMMGFKDSAHTKACDALQERYGNLTEKVHDLFETLFYKSSEEIEKGIPTEILLLFSPDMGGDEAVERLASLRFKEPEGAWERVKVLREGPSYAHLSPRAQLLLGTIAPFLLLQAEKSPDPDTALEHIEEFLTAIGGRSSFYALLAENREIMVLLVRLFSVSLLLSRAFIEHPENIEILFSRELNKPVKSNDEMYLELDTLIREMGDHYEDTLDSMRRFRNGEVIRIGINDLSGAIAPVSVSRQLSSLADVSLQKAHELAWEAITGRFGTPENPQFSIIGLGKLGGRELMYSSDIDIVFIYEAGGENTGGPKVISSREFFAKVAQHIITTLSIPTKEGIVFKVDTRLRPSGNAGPLVTTRDALLRYHRESAQIWERQAMIKARFVCGNEAFGREVLEELHHIVFSRGANRDDCAEIYRIRKRMEREIARETPTRYNIKTGYGGMVDIEFIVQTIQLKYGGKEPSIRTPNTLEALEKLRERGLVTPETHTLLRDGYIFYTLLENRLRILLNRAEGDLIRGSRTLTTLARELGHEGNEPWEGLLEEYTGRTRRVRELFIRLMKVRDMQCPY